PPAFEQKKAPTQQSRESVNLLLSFLGLSGHTISVVRGSIIAAEINSVYVLSTEFFEIIS
ncbi:MAG: hypothetical protein IJQ08_07890, partial [Synergistaceae bacterium]|nr:hypothetical protein [Synergistaceae bacterium]